MLLQGQEQIMDLNCKFIFLSRLFHPLNQVAFD